MKLTRLMDPNRSAGDQRARNHYAAPDGKLLLCGLGEIFREIDGDQYRIWHETKRPVDCAACTKRMETLTRMQLHGLNTEQLEEILAHIASFKS